MKLYVCFTFIFLTLLSCTPAEEADKTAEVLNNGVFTPVEFEIIGDLDRGEFLLGGTGDVITLRIKNNSSYKLTNVMLDIDSASTASVKFNPDDNGDSQSPGDGGSCLSEIPAGVECTFELFYNPSISGEHIQGITLSYENLVDTKTVSASLSFLTGNAASLIFEGDAINYSYGVVERTEPVLQTKTLVVKNTGGLKARGITVSKFDNTTSSAFTMLNNTCPVELAPGEQCQFEVTYSPKNWGPAAPDGNVDIDYSSNIRFDYVRDPEGGASALNAYFDSLATTIEGRIEVGGLPNIEFDDIVVGNIDDVNIKIENKGYKEAILTSFDIRDKSNNLIARCVNAGNTYLDCRNPVSDITDSANNLDLPTVPFRIKDLNNCMISDTQINYTRNPDDSLSDPAIKQIAARTTELPGEACFFNVTFHPSVTFASDGDFTNYRFNIRFDSTWKEGIVIYNDLGTYDNNFTIDSANYLSAAKLSYTTLEYANSIYSNEDLTDNGVFAYNLGRVSLISDSNYKQRVKLNIENSGTDIAEIVSIKDGATPSAFSVSDTSTNLNTFYQSVKHNNCVFLNGTNGSCSMNFDLNPLASTNPDGALAEGEENALMYDHLGIFPDRYKKFTITYKDGTTYNDDLTLRSNRTIDVKIIALLVRKGFLAFTDYTLSDGSNQGQVFGDTNEFFHLKVKNVGTGGITYLNVPAVSDLPGMPSWSPNASTNQNPVKLINNPSTAVVGADKDCYEVFDLEGGGGPATAAPGANAPSLLNPNETCTLTFEYKRNLNDKFINSDFSNAEQEWERYFSSDNNGTNESRQFSFQRTEDLTIKIDFYDGDGIADAGTGYTPGLAGHGNIFTTPDYIIKRNYNVTASLFPKNPRPIISGIMWRPSLTTPLYAITGDEWGNNLPAQNVAEQWRDLSKGLAIAPVTYALTSSKTHMLAEKDNSYDYVYHAGTFYAGETSVLGFTIGNSGSATARSIITSLSGDAEFSNISTQAQIGGASEANYSLDFSPTTSGVYRASLELEYEDGSKTLTDRDTYTYSNNTKTLKILIVADAVDSNSGRLSISSEVFQVDYNEGTGMHTELLLPGTTLHNLKYNDVDPATIVEIEAVKGSKIYALTKLTATNTGTTTLNDMTFYIKNGLESALVQNVSGGLGYSLDSSTCTGSIAPGATCEVILKHDASSTEPPETNRVGFFSYELSSNQYYAESFQIDFLAVDPAKVAIPSVTTQIINTPGASNGFTSQPAYPIEIGYLQDTDHPLLDSFPGDTIVKNITLSNTEGEKASFLKQYRTFVGNPSATPPAGVWTKVYDAAGLVVEMGRSCFFGNDEGSGVIPVEEWGFKDAAGSNCNARVSYTYDETYLGLQIPADSTYAVLEYYDSKRASYDSLVVYITGFVEPNKSSVASSNLYNVTVDSSGNAHLEWDSFTENNLSWGSLKGYRVYYSELDSVFTNPYDSSTVSYQDTIDTTPSIDLVGLVKNRFYYIYITALRDTVSGKEYVSTAPEMNILEIIVPDDDVIYDYSRRMLIDKFVLPEGGGVPDFQSKQDSIDACDSETRTIKKKGLDLTKKKSLITKDDYYVIKEDEVNNSDYVFEAFPHWFGDGAQDIAAIFDPGTFSCANTSFLEPANDRMYVKSCGDCTCNNLSQLSGSGGEFPMDTIVYIYDDFLGAARCKISQSAY